MPPELNPESVQHPSDRVITSDRTGRGESPESFGTGSIWPIALGAGNAQDLARGIKPLARPEPGECSAAGRGDQGTDKYLYWLHETG